MLAGSPNVCPRCGVRGPVRLDAGKVCAACEAQEAWAAHEHERLVIDHAAIDEAVRRREGDLHGVPFWRRHLWALPAALSLACAAASVSALVVFLSARPIGPLGPLLDGLRGDAGRAAAMGGVALVVSLVALFRLRRHRHYRKLPLLAAHLSGTVAGASALVVGLLAWFSLRQELSMAHTTMPPLPERSPTSPRAERIIRATVVILAPDRDGDARGLGIGAGAIVARDATRAWIVSCRHVVHPHGPSSWPVWVQLSDGRAAAGRVRWTAPPPLDVALVEVPIADAPDPVPIRADSADVAAGAPVTFVPNPYRAGWLVHRGEVTLREKHDTPIGEFSLLYTDLPVQRGDSGSGLFDEHGQLVGLNTWARIDGGGPQGISLPSEAIHGALAAVQAHDAPEGP